MYRYESLVSLMHEWVAGGVLKPGDRVLSVREMSAKLGYSAVTVYHAYGILEDEGILESRPRSGFFVSMDARPLPEFSAMPAEDPSLDEEVEPTDVETALFPLTGGGGTELESFGSLCISSDLLPYGELYRELLSALRREGARYRPVPWQGAMELRDAIARRPGVLSTGMSTNDIAITTGSEASVGLCLDLLTKPGDKVLMETPTDPGTVSVALQRRLQIVEIYSHPRFGVDPEQFQYLLDQNDFAACVLAPNSHVPTGVSYPVETAQQIVETATRKGVPIIENMTTQDLLYGAAAGVNLSLFDSGNQVWRVGGFGATLGPRFGLGWIALPRRNQARYARQLLDREPLAGDNAIQLAVAEYLGRRSHEKHLRRLREGLSARMRKGLSVLFQRFPENCTVSRPSGGYFCWVRGPKRFNAVAAAKVALADNASFAPGPMFSVTRSFGNFIALNLSHPWTLERERQMARIGQLLERANDDL
ncbi:MAG TPA: PLP-dependent aminotransferase family protein [Devosiaceae bacterium]|jgi:DNA-binding transcriptional MocR family regulator|nr:PLP-dependent aminotransferase family protein [Devosiaceae bacterium]